ncbi:uncharacterized protein LOC108148045 isoform X2 [Drosophila elegans]|uniref:uncharacterized protein LOC108148045 isoform X2 n=1 Tax=Drosophila elegans TaxID=30023 RepID=UPI0007E76719|nr:uncharacterized protein LOC108148045 isoform X2 [Drosophila elegans]
MKCGLFLLLASVIAFQNLAVTNANPNSLPEEVKTNPYLKEIYNQVERVGRLQWFKVDRFLVTDYLSKNGGDQLLNIKQKISWISMQYDIAMNMARDFNNYDLQYFANIHVTKRNYGNLKVMDELHLKLFGNEDLIGKLASGNQLLQEYTCRLQQSPQQFLYSLYVDYIHIELKAHLLMEWSWMFLRKFGQGGSIEDESRFRRAYKRRTPSTLPRIMDLMSRADRSVWSCDSREHYTYTEVTRLLQGYIANEVDLSPYGTCWSDCAHYKSIKSEGGFDDNLNFEQPKCSGRVYDCRSVESNMKVCSAEYFSNRRYQFIQYESGKVHGKGGSCSTRFHNANSWNRWVFWKCSYCLCLCDEKDQGTQSDRYFNLRPVIADVERNRVVTGVRFEKLNRVFHLLIQEGELQPFGVINETTLQWKPVDGYSITDKDVQEGVDFHMLTYEKRSVDLDELKSENNSMVTGLRFKSGLLIAPKTTSYWVSGSNDQPRHKLSPKDAELSTRSPVPSKPLPSENHFIEFTNSGFEQDVGQSTVPFIDIQDVFSFPAVPLSGIGLYYKGQDGFGGFLAPKLITYDFTPHVQLPSWESMQT